MKAQRTRRGNQPTGSESNLAKRTSDLAIPQRKRKHSGSAPNPSSFTYRVLFSSPEVKDGSLFFCISGNTRNS